MNTADKRMFALVAAALFSGTGQPLALFSESLPPPYSWPTNTPFSSEYTRCVVNWKSTLPLPRLPSARATRQYRRSGRGRRLRCFVNLTTCDAACSMRKTCAFFFSLYSITIFCSSGTSNATCQPSARSLAGQNLSSVCGCAGGGAGGTSCTEVSARAAWSFGIERRMNNV